MSSTAEMWRKVVHAIQLSLDMSQRPWKANMCRYKSVDQSRPWSWSRQVRDVTSNYFVLIGCIKCSSGSAGQRSWHDWL